MTTEQMAEQYAEERYSDDKVSSNADKETLHTLHPFRRIAKQAYLDGANGRWVKVEDGLPEIYDSKEFEGRQSDYVMVMLTDKEIMKARIEQDMNGEGGWFCHSFDDYIEDVTHWAILPTPPQV